jgi:hypothetical protein
MKQPGHHLQWNTSLNEPEVDQGIVNGWHLSWNPDDGRFYVGAIVENKYLIDSSIDQAERPHKEIFFPAILVAEINRDFRRGKEKLTIINDRGTVIVYEPKIKDRKWEVSPDWTVISRHIPAIERILLEIQQELEFRAVDERRN